MQHVPLDIEDIERLNTATKYPSIPTYHKMCGGRLSGDRTVDFDDDEVLITEKVDGTNVRVILFDDMYIIGSRNHLLYAYGDLLYNPTNNIVVNVVPYATKFKNHIEVTDDEPVVVIYGELYGGKIGKNAKNYTSSGRYDLRVFDIVRFTYDDEKRIERMRSHEIAMWRDNGGQPFIPFDDVEYWCRQAQVPIVPTIARFSGREMPTELDDTRTWMEQVSTRSTNCVIDGDPGSSEGYVVRNPSRSKIAKLRFEDYDRVTVK